MSIIVTLDIETLQPNWEPPKDQPDLFAPLPFHVPCAIVWLLVDTTNWGFRLEVRSFESEANDTLAIALGHLANDLRVADRIVTWNGRAFDMPLLGLQALKYGVDWSFWLDKRHRYGRYKHPLVHYDLMEQLGDEGAVRRGLKMDTICHLVGLPGKGEMDGGQVTDAWRDDPQSVATYCCEDVVQTWMLYLYWTRTFKGKNVERWLERTIEYASGQSWLKGWTERLRVSG